MKVKRGKGLANHEDISHAGVLGMKWGRRKGTTSGEERPESKRQAKQNVKLQKQEAKRIHKESAEREKKWNDIYQRRAKISDAEMRSALNRLQLENQFAQQVKTARELTPTPQKKSLYQQMSPVVVTASKMTPVITGALSKNAQNHKLAVGANKLAKSIVTADNVLNPKKDKKD